MLTVLLPCFKPEALSSIRPISSYRFGGTTADFIFPNRPRTSFFRLSLSRASQRVGLGRERCSGEFGCGESGRSVGRPCNPRLIRPQAAWPVLLNRTAERLLLKVMDVRYRSLAQAAPGLSSDLHSIQAILPDKRHFYKLMRIAQGLSAGGHRFGLLVNRLAGSNGLQGRQVP